MDELGQLMEVTLFRVGENSLTLGQLLSVAAFVVLGIFLVI